LVAAIFGFGEIAVGAEGIAQAFFLGFLLLLVVSVLLGCMPKAV
jgi:uncharacterized membrane protein YtjA (UPF0391 family)